MDPSCSYSKCNLYKDTRSENAESNEDNKTDSEEIINDKDNIIRNFEIEDVENQYLKEDNKFLTQCTGIIADLEKSNLASSSQSRSQTISDGSHLQSDLTSTGCSKNNLGDDSNGTIKGMIESNPPSLTHNLRLYVNEDDSDDEYSVQAACSCSSIPPDDLKEDEEIDDLELTETCINSNISWRKRPIQPSPPPYNQLTVKKLCIEVTDSVSSEFEGLLSPDIIDTSLVEGPPGVNRWLNSFLAWSKTDKIEALDALINFCGASQIRHMMNTIEPLLQRDFISLLPKELALTVLGYLHPKDLVKAAQICRYWRFLADDKLLWKEQCRRIGIVRLRRSAKYTLYANPWKASYMRHHLIESNWIYKSVNKPIIMRGHGEHVITCLQFYGKRILSGSDDTTLKVWSAVTGKCLRTLVGHSGGVWSSQMIGDLVVSGSTDRTLRVWNARRGRCLKILAGHTSTVRCLHLHQHRVVSGSRDATLRIWSLLDGRCLHILVGHLAAVRCVQFNGKVVVSGAYDYDVKVWDPESGECLHTLSGHTNRVYSLQFDGIHIASGSLDTTIKVWDVNTGELKHTLIGHQSLTSGMALHSHFLVSGNADSTVKVWDINSGRCVQTLSGYNKHQSAVTCLQTVNRFVITSSDDGTVKLWDVRTGMFIRNLVELKSSGSGGVVWRIRASSTKLICAAGSRNGTELTKLLVLNFDVPRSCKRCY